MLVDRQKGQNQIRRYRVADRLVVKTGRRVRQACTESRYRQGSKLGGLAKERIEKAGVREIHAGCLAQPGTERQETQGYIHREK